MRKLCPLCRKLKDDVETRPDHFAQDVGNESGATMTCCGYCEEQNALDI